VLHYIFNKEQADFNNGSTLIDRLKTVTVVRAGASWHLGP